MCIITCRYTYINYIAYIITLYANNREYTYISVLFPAIMLIFGNIRNIGEYSRNSAKCRRNGVICCYCQYP